MNKGVLAISAAILMAAVMILPGMAYSVESDVSPYPFSIGAEDRPAFTVVAGTPAHAMVSGAVGGMSAPSYSISTGKPYQYSIGVTPTGYSIGLPTGEAAPVVEAPVVEEPVVEAPVVEEPEVVEPVTYAISGTVSDNDTMVGLAGWTVNLEGLTNTTTAEDGTYSFTGLDAGDYVVSVDAMDGWVAVAPVTLTIVDADATADFVMTAIPVVEEPVEPVVEEPVAEEPVEPVVEEPVVEEPVAEEPVA